MNYSEQQKKAYNELKKRLVAYMSSVQSIYDNISAQASSIALDTDYDADSGEVFSFKDYPEQRTAIEKMQNDFISELSSLIDNGITSEWKSANEAQNLLVNSMFESIGVKANNFRDKKYFQLNEPALKAFKSRKDRGMGLSAKIWQQSKDLQDELADAISVSIQRGMSAITLSKRISKYLSNFAELRRDYGEKFGIAIRTKDCQYHSIRLARTEINMAYRSAEQERWRQFDFVLGYRIKLSKNHTCKGIINFYDICDELEGDYPKDFIWAGWHPSCRCYAIPILMSEAEFERYNRGEETTEKPITEMPKQFDEWLATNADRIENAQERGTLPYFLRDNKQLLGEYQYKGAYLSTKLGRKASKDAYLTYSNEKPISLTEEQKNNLTEIAKALGIPEEDILKIKPMLFLDANNGKGNYYYSQGGLYRENCQCCVAVHEARLRGLNITAKPYDYNSSSVQWELGEYFQNMWINPKTGKVPTPQIVKSDNDKDIYSMLDNQTKPSGRYHIGINFKKNNVDSHDIYGHTITAERLKSGEIIFYDPQCGKFINIREYTEIEYIEVLKVDKLLFNKDKLVAISDLL